MVLPDWLLRDYVQRNYITSKTIGEHGMKGILYAAIREAEATNVYMQAFLELSQSIML